MNLDNLTDVLETARILKDKIEYINYINPTDNKELININAILSQDCTAYNCELIEEYVKMNRDRIEVLHQETIKG